VTGLGTPDFGKLKTIVLNNNLPLPSTLGGLLPANLLPALLDAAIDLLLKLL